MEITSIHAEYHRKFGISLFQKLPPTFHQAYFFFYTVIKFY